MVPVRTDIQHAHTGTLYNVTYEPTIILILQCDLGIVPRVEERDIIACIHSHRLSSGNQILTGGGYKKHRFLRFYIPVPVIMGG